MEEARDGDDACDLLDVIDPFLLREPVGCGGRGMALSLAGAIPDIALPATPPVVPTVLPLFPVKPLVVVAAVFALLVLRFEDDL